MSWWGRKKKDKPKQDPNAIPDVIPPLPARSLPPVEDWPQAPILLRMNPYVEDLKIADDKNNADLLKTNIEGAVFSFDSKLFKGKAFVRCRGLDSSDEKGYFGGKNRTTQVVVSGQFKKELPLAAITCGQEFDRKLKNLPWVATKILALVKVVVPSLKADFTSDKPGLTSVFASLAQTIWVQELSEPEPDMMGELIEETKLLGGAFAKGCTITERKKILGDKKQKDAYTVKPGLRYTFDMYQHRLVWSSFSWASPFGCYPLTGYMDGQPMQILAKVGDDYLWAMEMWHESLVEEHRAYIKKVEGWTEQRKKEGEKQGEEDSAQDAAEAEQ